MRDSLVVVPSSGGTGTEVERRAFEFRGRHIQIFQLDRVLRSLTFSSSALMQLEALAREPLHKERDRVIEDQTRPQQKSEDLGGHKPTPSYVFKYF